VTVDAELPAGVPGIDVPRLAAWLAGTLPDAGQIIGVELIAGGRSNLTYRIRLSGTPESIVLRRPPLGHVLPTAHDMTREHRVLSGLSAAGTVPVPRPLALCTDEEVIGAPFYLMGYVEGRVLRTAADAADVSPTQARELSKRLAEALAAVHEVDLEAAGLSDFGRPAGYMARQFKRWGQQWERSYRAGSRTVDPLTEYERLVTRLAERLPENGLTRLVHGDFRLDNALSRLEPHPEIAAIVDWEMSTLGDPVADLGLTLVYWAEATDPEVLPVGSTLTAAPGFLTRREFSEHYAALTGFDLSDLEIYVAFGCYKLAVVLEGIHARFLQNATVGEGFDQIGDAVPVLIARAHRILDTHDPF
jgi:aminoglycoside phosphotransferase (APT) family kinase protein